MAHLDEKDPKLLLNEAIPGLKQVLSLRADGIGHRIRDTLVHSFNQGIMMELCALGLAELDPASLINQLTGDSTSSIMCPALTKAKKAKRLLMMVERVAS